jgi:hypothetical protein
MTTPTVPRSAPRYSKAEMQELITTLVLVHDGHYDVAAKEMLDSIIFHSAFRYGRELLADVWPKWLEVMPGILAKALEDPKHQPRFAELRAALRLWLGVEGQS